MRLLQLNDFNSKMKTMQASMETYENQYQFDALSKYELPSSDINSKSK